MREKTQIDFHSVFLLWGLGLEVPPGSDDDLESRPTPILTLNWSQLPARTSGRLRGSRRNLLLEEDFEKAVQTQIAKIEPSEMGQIRTPLEEMGVPNVKGGTCLPP